MLGWKCRDIDRVVARGGVLSFHVDDACLTLRNFAHNTDAELKKALFHVFSQFGTITEINAHKDLKRKGQVTN